MTDVEALLTATLRTAADGEVDAAVLLREATTRGRRHRRRRAWTAAGLAAVTTLAGAGLVLGTQLWPGDARSGGGIGAAGPGARPAAALPMLTGEPAAATAPERVGADPTIVHFDAPAVTSVARHHAWTSGPGYEKLRAGLGEQDWAEAALGPDPAVLDEGEREGGPGSVLRTQPVPGLWLRVEASTATLARQVADAVRLDRVQRIVLPFQLGRLPADARVARVRVGFIGRDFVDGGVLLTRAGRDEMEVQAQDGRGGQAEPSRANLVEGGRQLYVYPSRDEVQLLDAAEVHLTARIGKAHGGFTVEDAAPVLAGIRVAAEVRSMSTWPESPVG